MNINSDNYSTSYLVYSIRLISPKIAMNKATFFHDESPVGFPVNLLGLSTSGRLLIRHHSRFLPCLVSLYPLISSNVGGYFSCVVWLRTPFNSPLSFATPRQRKMITMKTKVFSFFSPYFPSNTKGSENSLVQKDTGE